MADERNEGRLTIWSKRKGQYGEYVTVNFQINGVEYVVFAEATKSTNPKAPPFSGKIKVKQQGGYKPQQAASPTTFAVPTAQVDAPAPTDGSLPF